MGESFEQHELIFNLLSTEQPIARVTFPYGSCNSTLIDASNAPPLTLQAAKVVSIFCVNVSLFWCDCGKITNLRYCRVYQHDYLKR